MKKRIVPSPPSLVTIMIPHKEKNFKNFSNQDKNESCKKEWMASSKLKQSIISLFFFFCYHLQHFDNRIKKMIRNTIDESPIATPRTTLLGP